jgi:DNA-binding PadR family transcriptional regulator
MVGNYREEIQNRIVKDMLDIHLLRMVLVQALWGYKIKKKVEEDLHIRLRHGALYPTLNSLERRGFLVSQKEQKDGRSRKVYVVTDKGVEYLYSYYSIISEQISVAWWYPLVRL